MNKYFIWCPDQGEKGPDDGKMIEAYYIENAVENWAEDSDSDGDYWISDGGGATVIVRDEHGNESTFIVDGVPTIEYYAREIK